MRRLAEWILWRFGLKRRKERKDKYVVINGVKYRVVAEPYLPPKGK